VLQPDRYRSNLTKRSHVYPPFMSGMLARISALSYKLIVFYTNCITGSTVALSGILYIEIEKGCNVFYKRVVHVGKLAVHLINAIR